MLQLGAGNRFTCRDYRCSLTDRCCNSIWVHVHVKVIDTALIRPAILSSVCPSVQQAWLGMRPDSLSSPCHSGLPACLPNVSKETPTAPTADPGPSWLSAPSTQIVGGSDDYRGTWTQIPGKTSARACNHSYTLTVCTYTPKLGYKLFLLMGRQESMDSSIRPPCLLLLRGFSSGDRRVSFHIYLLICCTLVTLQQTASHAADGFCRLISFFWKSDSGKELFPRCFLAPLFVCAWSSKSMLEYHILSLATIFLWIMNCLSLKLLR